MLRGAGAMRRWGWMALGALGLAAAGCSGNSDPAPVGAEVDGQITINEIQVVNVLSAKDQSGATGAWIELYNPTDRNVPLAGYGVTDFLDDPHKKVLPAGVVLPAGGHLVLWCDGNSASGATHVDLLLSRAGGAVGLSRPDGSYIDRVSFGVQEVDFSAAREPDGSTNWVTEWAVSPGAANPAGDAQPAGAEVATDPPEAVPDPGDLSERFLGYDLIPNIDLRISDDGMASLRANPNNWTQAMLVYAGRSYGPVGVNLKGTASFQPIDGKAAFRVNADKFDKQARFFGLKEFLLNNMTVDPSMMHERLGYWAMRQVGGVPASRSNHAVVTVNGQPYGLYANVEEPKDPLMARYFPNPSGSVYTIHYADFVGADLTGFQLQDGPDDTTLITGLTNALTLKPADAAMAAAAQFVDVHAFNRYWAACVVTGHWGGWPYAPANEPAGANAGTFADPTTNKLYFIPEGINDTFMTADFDFIKQLKSVLPKTCAASPACYQDFVNQVWEILTKLEHIDWKTEQTRVAAQIAPYAAADPKKPYSDGDVANFQTQMQNFITSRWAYVSKYIPPPSP